jgi:hypothetical protein
MKKLIFFALVLALSAFAASKTFHVTFDHDGWVGATQIKAGDYKVTVDGDKATLKSGKNVVEVPAKLESSDHQFQVSGVVMKQTGDKQQIQEIQIGDSKNRIVFPASTATGGE